MPTITQGSLFKEIVGINTTGIKAIAFDYFGTLLDIQNPQSPYRERLNMGKI